MLKTTLHTRTRAGFRKALSFFDSGGIWGDPGIFRHYPKKIVWRGIPTEGAVNPPRLFQRYSIDQQKDYFHLEANLQKPLHGDYQTSPWRIHIFH